jgi:hypothetical protein
VKFELDEYSVLALQGNRLPRVLEHEVIDDIDAAFSPAAVGVVAFASNLSK